MRCEWCHSSNVTNKKKTAYWELPDGTRALEITDIEAIKCSNCGMSYILDNIIEEIEDQLILIHTRELPASISYKDLMAKERLLKRNYFKGLSEK